MSWCPVLLIPRPPDSASHSLLDPLSLEVQVAGASGRGQPSPRGSGWSPGVASAVGQPSARPRPSRQLHTWATGGRPARSAGFPEHGLQEHRHEGGEAVATSPLRPATGSQGLGVPDARPETQTEVAAASPSPAPLPACGRVWGSRRSLREPSGGELGSQAWPV